MSCRARLRREGGSEPTDSDTDRNMKEVVVRPS